MLKTLYISSVSACFELVSDKPWFSPESYTISLNGRADGAGDTNVFSLFSLHPDTEYHLDLHFASGGGESLDFRTSAESCAVDVRSFGTKGDGVTDDTSSIQSALHFLPEGGRLYFPPGTYRCLPLALKSRIHLDFAEGAVLLGSPERSRYPILPGVLPDLDGGTELRFGTFEGCAVPMFQSLLTAQYAEDITITGPGCVDGNGAAFWRDFRDLPAARPRLLFFNRCRRVRVHGLRLKDSPSWQIHPFDCEDTGFYGVHVTAPKDSPNTDALNPESCDGTEIIGCRFNVGDDCIAIKSGKLEANGSLNHPASRCTIRNCLMESGHGAVTLGSEISAGVRELTVSHCLFRGTDRGLRIKTRRGRGENCRVDGVCFENIRMEGVLTPITMNMWYNCCDADRESEYVWSRKKLPVDERTPYLGRFCFRNIRCTDAHAAACYVDGLPEMPVAEVVLENVSVRFASDARPAVPIMKNFAEPCCRLGFYFDHVSRVVLRNVSLSGVSGEPVVAQNCGEVSAEGLNAGTWAGGAV